MTKLELTIENIKVSWEHPSNNLTANELVQAFNGLLIAQTFHPESVSRAMSEFTEDALPGYVNQ